VLEGAGLTDFLDAKRPPSAIPDSGDEKYVPRPRLANVLSIQERMMRDHVKEK
jgi:hypothetical protein